MPAGSEGAYVAREQVEDRDGVVRIPGNRRILRERELSPVRRPGRLFDPVSDDRSYSCAEAPTRADEDFGPAFSARSGGGKGDELAVGGPRRLDVGLTFVTRIGDEANGCRSGKQCGFDRS